MVYGRQFGTPKSKFGELRDLERTFGPERKVMAPPKFFANNANSALLRELWESHHFDEILPGQEDIEWAKHWMERGYKVIYEPAAGIYHKHDESWRQVKLRYYREAVATRAIGVWGSQSAIGLAFQEIRYLASDTFAAVRGGELLSRGREIASFRALKAYGTVSVAYWGQRQRTLVLRGKTCTMTGSARPSSFEAPIERLLRRSTCRPPGRVICWSTSHMPGSPIWTLGC